MLEDVVAHARQARPQECCGILLGSGDDIFENVRAANIADSRTARFVIDPQDHINARRLARSKNLEVVGFYHSHPHSAAYPSPTDLAESMYADAVHLIVGFVDETSHVRVFRYAQNGVQEVSFVRSEF